MRSRRILTLATILATSIIGIGAASAEDNDRYDRYGHDHHGDDCDHASHAKVDVNVVDYRQPYRRYHRPPRARVQRPYWRRYRPVRRAYRPFYQTYVPSRAERILYRNDMNGDGYITWWEARRNPSLRRHFNHIDRNRDGYLTTYEIDQHYDH